jgi:hypothetical protein
MISREQLNQDYYEAQRDFADKPAPEQREQTANMLLVQIREVLLDMRDLLVSIDRRID